MLNSLLLENYRCFEKTELKCKDITVIVGSNNAGKSTVIESLRIVSESLKKCKTARYEYIPSYFNVNTKEYGFYVRLDEIKIDLRTVVYNYKEGISAKICADLNNGTQLKIYVNSEGAFACLYDSGNLVKRAKDAKNLDINEINIMPQIGLIREAETILSEDTVKRHLNTRLSSRHFRNEIMLYKEQYYEKFKNLAEQTWNGLRIQGLERIYEEKESIELLIYDEGFSAEIGNMGSGIQMWLQIIWFISHCEKNSTVVLDEPDVYMHPDLQKKLLRIAKRMFNQVIIATHSVEIISSVEPSSIVCVDKKSRKLRYANDIITVQNIINIIGGTQNLALIRLGTANKCIFADVKDMNLLGQFEQILKPNAMFQISDIPSVSLGGWTKFDECIGASNLFYENVGRHFCTYCILNRDYHLDEEINEMKKVAEENHLKLIIWSRKELENFILEPKALYRLIGQSVEQYNHFYKALDDEINQMKDEAIKGLMDQLIVLSGYTPSKAFEKAKEHIESRWGGLKDKLSHVNSENAIKQINAFLKRQYKVNCSRNMILQVLEKEDIDTEVLDVIEQLIN